MFVVKEHFLNIKHTQLAIFHYVNSLIVTFFLQSNFDQSDADWK